MSNIGESGAYGAVLQDARRRLDTSQTIADDKRRLAADTKARDDLAATYKANAVMPSHYRRMKIEPLQFAVENELNPFQTKVIKYVCRAEHKNGIEDLMKAKRVIEMYIKRLEGDPDWWKAPPDAS